MCFTGKKKRTYSNGRAFRCDLKQSFFIWLRVSLHLYRGIKLEPGSQFT